MKGDINPNLTKRELEVLKLLFDGYTYKEVAQLLGVARQTVKLHIGSAKGKLGVHTVIRAVVVTKDKDLI